MRAVIIEDIREAQEYLANILEEFCPEVEMAGVADGVLNGAKLIREKRPDLIFLDVELTDGTGFDLLQILSDIQAQVIFTTASEGYAIDAFRVSAVDYLLKPVDADDLISAVKRAQRMAQTPEQMHLLKEQLKTSAKIPKRLALHTLDKIHIVEVSEIVRIESDGNYSNFHLADKTKIMVTRTLKEYDKLLAAAGFIRVHQSHLINGLQLKTFIKTDGGYCIMQDGSKVPVSTRKRSKVVEALEEL